MVSLLLKYELLYITLKYVNISHHIHTSMQYVLCCPVVQGRSVW